MGEKSSHREARLANALRANLKRRKVAAQNAGKNADVPASDDSQQNPADEAVEPPQNRN